MRKKEPISKIMTTKLITLSYADSLYLAEEKMKVNHIRHIPIVEEGTLVGLLSLSDLKRVSFIDAYSQEGDRDTPIYDMLNIEDLMIKNPIVVSSDTSILDVTKLMIQKEFHSLPVVDHGKLVGIVTTTDILEFFIDYC
ncbi:MAG: CBS domain-containing protein [Flavobacteriaceae bacterium]|nr:CBS domain-containing protein [Flavobacteriaceae bacterium]